MRIAKDMGDRKQEMQLEPPVPHLDARHLERAAPEQRRLRLQRLEVAADCDRLRDHRAVIEDQRRHPHDRIDRGEGVRFLLHGAEIDRLDRHLDPLLRQKYPRAPRIGRAPPVVKLHASVPCSAPAGWLARTTGCMSFFLYTITSIGPWSSHGSLLRWSHLRKVRFCAGLEAPR